MNAEPEPGYKFIWYYGHKLEIPEDHYFVATDENGLIFSYKHLPIKDYDYDINCWSCDNFHELHAWRPVSPIGAKLAERWQDTLVEYSIDYEFTEKKQ